MGSVIFIIKMGGLKAVVWTDTIQTVMMFGAVIAVAILGTARVGGVAEVWKRNDDTGRIEFFNMDPDPTIRHTFWTVVVGNYLNWLATCSVNQAMVQRCLAMPNLKKSNVAIMIMAVGIISIVSLCCYTGIVIFAAFYDCDPVTTKVRNLIIKDCKRGVSQRKIAQKYEVSKSAVQKLYKKFLDTGTVVNRSGKEFWKRVLWTDKSKFELFGCKQRLRVWRKTNKELEDHHLQKTVKQGRCNIMIWGCFSWEGVGQLVKFDGIMTVNIYIYILCENLEVSLIQLSLENNFILQQDNDPKHTAKKTKKFFISHHIKLLDWPPQSPDLNPIEILWSILDRNVDKTGVTNKNNYFDALQRAWENLDLNNLHNLVESMPRRLAAVIKAKGGHTKY
ncbi:sodium-coupled monocarboxylate transporter 1 [Lasius niger]|uniref:Sodium-coupled monocarboxylate transporter 1 n=1 Tax=Lasius niger TaxID=67767 RepID=A0A0J7KJJ6_LASNI|nr:sodium-coupled monocarboxylate transporter 1 [Lasius niger]